MCCATGRLLLHLFQPLVFEAWADIPMRHTVRWSQVYSGLPKWLPYEAERTGGGVRGSWIQKNPIGVDRNSRRAMSSRLALPASKTRTVTEGSSDSRAARVSPAVWGEKMNYGDRRGEDRAHTPPPITRVRVSNEEHGKPYKNIPQMT